MQSLTLTPLSQYECQSMALPEKAGYRVETKEQYRSRGKELTESTQDDLDGWTLYDSETATSWGEWSEWKDGSAFNVGSGTPVETRETSGNTAVYYNLYYYEYWNAAAGAWYYSYSSSNGGTKHTAKAPASDRVPYQSFDGHQAYSYNGFDLWWIESTSNVTLPAQQYRTRSKVETTTYYYYRWGDWSSWQDAPLTARWRAECCIAMCQQPKGREAAVTAILSW